MSGAITASVVGAVAGGYLAKKGAKDAANTQAGAIEDASDQIAKQVSVARDEVKKLQEPAERNLLAGAQSAMNTLGQSVPEQLRLAQEGNMAAQNILGQGLGQYQQALFGNALPTAPQPTQFDYNLPEFSLPNFQSTSSALDGQFGMVNTPDQQQTVIDEQATQAPSYQGYRIGDILGDVFSGRDYHYFDGYGPYRRGY